VTLLAGQTALWVWLGLAAGFLFVLATLALLADVQRFIALTEEARSLVPAGLPLFDGEKGGGHDRRARAPSSHEGRSSARSLDFAKRAPRNREHKAPATQHRPSRSWQWPTEQSGGGRGLVGSAHPRAASQIRQSRRR
jgi:hypothetical protein